MQDQEILKTINTIKGELKVLAEMIAALSEEVESISSATEDERAENEPSDQEQTPQPFDPVACTPGIISFDKAPEDITTKDVAGALALPRLCDTADLWRASEHFKAGTSASVKSANAKKFRELASAESECPGIFVDGEFYFNTGAGTSASKAIQLEKDFTIDGTDGMGAGVNGKLVSTGGYLLCTHHSLDFRNTRFEKDYAYGAYLIYVNTSEGIDMLQVMGCEFTNLGYKGRTIRIYGDKTMFPLDDKGVPIGNNCIGHINIDGNTVTDGGTYFVSSGGLRVTKSWRITNNIINDVAGTAVSFGSTDAEGTDSVYAGRMYYMSCPLWVVGNTFVGREGIFRQSTTSITYYCAALVEMNTVYMLHNEIRDFVAGESFLVSNGQTVQCHPTSYDLYANTTRIYYCNNTVRNLARFNTERTSIGVLKCKGCGVPGAYLDPHFTKCMKPVRYYRRNVYTCSGDDLLRLMQYWNNRAYSEQPSATGLKHDTAAEIAYDAEVEKDMRPSTTLKLVAQTTSNVIFPKFEIRENIFRYPVIGGISSGTVTKCDLMQVADNQFISDFITSEEYPVSDYVFCVRALRIEITGNTFTAKNSTIHLLLNKAYVNCGDLDFAEEVIEGNVYGDGSGVKNRKLKITSGDQTMRTKYDIPTINNNQDRTCEK